MAYLLGDSFAVLGAPETVQWPRDQRPACIVTSVPYWGLRGYATERAAKAWGCSGESLAEYLDRAAEFAAGCWRTLGPAGWVVVNVGDTRTGSGGSGGDYNEAGGYAGRAKYRQGPAVLPTGETLEPRQLAGVPFRLAEVFRAAGFLVRSHVVWVKQGPKPEDIGHVRRPLVQHETVWIFEKGRAPFYPAQVVQRSDVWPIRTARLPRVNPKPKAPWPPALVEAAIGPLTAPGDVVLDPFAGCGITGIQAEFMGRLPVLLDADEDGLESYLELRKVAHRIAVKNGLLPG